jgi:hypothetical protein
MNSLNYCHPFVTFDRPESMRLWHIILLKFHRHATKIDNECESITQTESISQATVDSLVACEHVARTTEMNLKKRAPYLTLINTTAYD